MKTIATAAGTPALPRPPCLRAVFTASALSALLLNGIWLGEAHADESFFGTIISDAKETLQEVISEETEAGIKGTRDAIKEEIKDTPRYDRPWILEIQNHLAALGYNPGPQDGVYGSSTQSAMIAFQLSNGHAVTGEPRPTLMRALRQARQTQMAEF